MPTTNTRGAAASYRAEFVQRDFSLETSQPVPARQHPDRPLVAVLCTPSDQRRDWLIAGRSLASVLLHAHLAGASASYLNQPVEEPAARVELAERLRLPGVPQLVLRLGEGGPVLPPPRRSPRGVTGPG